IVLDAFRDAKAGSRAEIAVLEDDALRQDDGRERFGGGHGIPNRGAFDFNIASAFETRLDAVEREIVRDRQRSMYFGPRPTQNSPRPADLATEEHLYRGSLRRIGELIDQQKRLAVPFMDRAGPVGID